MIKSRRHFLKFYLAITVASVILLFLAVFSLYLSYIAIAEREWDIKIIFIIPGILCVAASVYYPCIYFKYVPKIILTEDKIMFNKRGYNLSDIENIEFTGKRAFKPIVGPTYYFEALTIYFKNGKMESGFDVYYNNLWKIKQRLYANIDKYKHIQRTVATRAQKTSIPDATYKGNQFTSLTGITLWSTLIIGGLTINIPSNRPPQNFPISSFFFFGLFSSFSPFGCTYPLLRTGIS